jgi:hypothetical protein
VHWYALDRKYIPMNRFLIKRRPANAPIYHRQFLLKLQFSNLYCGVIQSCDCMNGGKSREIGNLPADDDQTAAPARLRFSNVPPCEPHYIPGSLLRAYLSWRFRYLYDHPPRHVFSHHAIDVFTSLDDYTIDDLHLAWQAARPIG